MKEFDIKSQIISLFRENKGSFVSGEDISEGLGFSRASTWKYIGKLRQDGYEIEAVPHLGYRLKNAPDKIYGYDLAIGLNTKFLGKKAIHHYEEIGSTNDRAYELAEDGAEEGTLVIAETQTHGRGRIRRKWVSPRTRGIYMSIIMRPDVGIDEVPAVTIIAALSVIKSIRKMHRLEAAMKWPNDVLLAGRKLCGILTEIKAQPDRVDFLILGIGINVNSDPDELPPGATSLKIELSSSLDRMELIRSLLEELEENYLTFEKEKFAALRDECRRLSMVLGSPIKVHEHGRDIEGMAVDIDEKGALLIRADTGLMHRVFSGDITLKQ